MKYDYLKPRLLELLKQGSPALENSISEAFFNEVKKNPDNSYEEKVIAGCLSMYLDADDKHTPYKPLFTSPQGRTFSLEDITDKDAEFLFENIEKDTDNIVILARIFDVLWITKKLKQNNPIAGEKASKYFNKCIIDFLKSKNYTAAAQIIKRYIKLSLNLAKDSVEFKKMIKKYIQWIQMDINSDNEWFLRNLYELYLEDITLGDTNKIISEKILENSLKYFNENFQTDNDLLLKIYVEIITKVAKNLKKHDIKISIWEKFSNYYCQKKKETEDVHKQIFLLKNAKSCLERLESLDYREQIHSLQHEIEFLEKKIPDTMNIVSSKKINLTKEINKSMEKISGLDTLGALITLAKNMIWIDEQYIEKNTYESSFEKILPCVVYNHKGQSKNTSKYSIAENRCITLYYDITFLRCNILPMLDIFRQEHRINPSTFIGITTNNPIVPQGYEKTYAKGLFYYINGDFLEAADILVPAFENSLRYLVSQKHPISYSKKEYIELDKVKIEEFIDILRQDKVIPDYIAFNLNLMFGRNEWNVRNELMHGFLPYDYINTVSVIVSLSMIFWFVMYPFCYLNNKS